MEENQKPQESQPSQYPPQQFQQPQQVQPNVPNPPTINPYVAQQPSSVDAAQAFAPAPTTTNPPQPSSVQQPSNLRHVFTVFGALQLIGVVLFMLALLFATQWSGEGSGGLQLMLVVILFVSLPIVGVLALINLISLPIFMVKHKAHGFGQAFRIISLIVSLAIVVYGAFTFYPFLTSGMEQYEPLPNEIVEIDGGDGGHFDVPVLPEETQP